MSTKYLSQLTHDEIIDLADIVEKGEKLSVEVDNCTEDSITIEIELAPYGEEGYSGIVDTYEFDDYSIVAYDVALSADDVFDYRRKMLSRFGSAYAKDFLLGYLETDL